LFVPIRYPKLEHGVCVLTGRGGTGLWLGEVCLRLLPRFGFGDVEVLLAFVRGFALFEIFEEECLDRIGSSLFLVALVLVVAHLFEGGSSSVFAVALERGVASAVARGLEVASAVAQALEVVALDLVSFGLVTG
jgi:hypothetical protein